MKPIKASKQISIGGVSVGGGAPIAIQSMTTTRTKDVTATVAQIHALEAAGCEIIRVAVMDEHCAQAIGQIKEQITIPLVADIHFDHKLALLAIQHGADKIRLNPGNIGGADNVRAVVVACKEKGIPIRIGVNGGSLETDIVAQYGHTPAGMVASAMGHIQLLNDQNFDDICLSVKASNVQDTVAAYRLLREKTDYPLHLGVTEAGTVKMGTLKNAIAMGALLLDGIGDTIRVSLTANPVEEVLAAKDILQAIGVRKFGAEVIACPTCGRCQIDVITLAKEVEARLKQVKKPITVAVMGCAVNGPGEARAADFGIAGGIGEGLLFAQGEVLRKVPMEGLADALMELVEEG